jgi:hypothetical protein
VYIRRFAIIIDICYSLGVNQKHVLSECSEDLKWDLEILEKLIAAFKPVFRKHNNPSSSSLKQKELNTHTKMLLISSFPYISYLFL